MRVFWIVPLVALLGCDLLLGIETGKTQLPDGGQGGAGADAAGGAGGQAGAPGGVLAPNWTTALGALYRFDDPVSDDTFTDSVQGRNLSHIDGPKAALSATHVEGAAAVALDGATLSWPGDVPPFNSPTVTWGGWFFVTNDQDSTPIDRFSSGGAGFELMRSGGRVTCNVSDGELSSKSTPSNSWPAQQWVHVACRATSMDIQAFVDGAPAPEAGEAAVLVPSTESFLVGGANFTGSVDEVFVTTQALSDPAIARIKVCRVDGSACRCDEDNPRQFLDCGGNGTVDCPDLACDQPSP